VKDHRLEVPLKDCPFCGGPAETDGRRTYRSIEGNLGKAVAVYCTGSCSADMTLCLEDVPGSTWEDLLAVLIENWNRRMPDPRIVEWQKSCTGKHGSQMPCVQS